MGDQGDKTPKGPEIRFVDGFVPPLTGGTYTVEAKQTLTLKHSEGPKDSFEADKKVYVSAPRFTLDPGEIYSVFPPPGQSGAFHTTLPHIVFTRKTLPWERGIDGHAGGTGASKPAILIAPVRPPWMALLTLDDDEIEQHGVVLRSAPLHEVFNPPEDVWRPGIPHEPGERADPSAEEQDHCLVADMPTSLFRDIAPMDAELRYLAHARQVDTEDKDLADAVADGWFSVVVGNRLPEQGKRNHGLLVSLEGFAEILKKEPPAGIPGKVRLAVLKEWTYVAEGLTFRELLDGLTESGEDGKEKDVWLRVYPRRDGTPNEDVQKALELGYTALTHRMRQGGRTVSWYRGPLSPTPLDAGTYHPIHANADEALRYDSTTGLFDVSYAAAWQLGRLLALQKSDFAQSLLRRRSGYVAEQTLVEANKMLGKWHGEKGGIDGQKAKLLLQDDLMVAILTEWWLSDAANPGENS